MRKVTVVTGGGRGIGAAVALRLARAGHDVGIGYERARDAAEATARAVRDAGGAAVAVQADVSREEDVDALFATVAGELGPVTGLVNNAGVPGPRGPFTETPVADIRRVIDVNLTGTVLCARRAALVMATSRGGAGGAIVNISSGQATLGGGGDYVHYAASKAGVDALTVGLSRELAGDGIRVNSVQPGVVDTEIHATMGDPDRAWTMGRAVPLGRPADPAEIASAVAWLMSDEASYTTGAVLRVAGGR
ncbi:putative oxidoreductase YgfF [Streptomyces sp. RB5]|uniref:Putative oxidoreductase YgfF n=1 Tax=Streptomyces smaragdinus TaxID=2585196 RepID=A0A7K0CB14_9ACTN|nr:SDR family oxidoreductase [Streptomyces smaragdinus]MQY10651.1 putative oxidoreductase YgfF [Streptomyces smaragdinus]